MKNKYYVLVDKDSEKIAQSFKSLEEAYLFWREDVMHREIVKIIETKVVENV